MADLKFVSGGYEFSTIPQACCRLYGHQVGESSNGKDHPSRDVIYKPVSLHLFDFYAETKSRNYSFFSNLKQEAMEAPIFAIFDNYS